MKYTCPKCGKTIELSTEALIASEYFTVCPQCLTRLQIVGNYAYVPLADGTLELSSGQHPAAQEPSPVKAPPVIPPLPSPEVAEQPPVAAAPGVIDPLMGEAIKFLAECNAITPVMLRDRFSIPMERAQALLAQLEQAGVVGPYQNGAPRAILIPHRNELPGAVRVTQMNDSDNEQQPAADSTNNRSFSFSCSGCVMWLLIIGMAILLFKHCGMH